MSNDKSTVDQLDWHYDDEGMIVLKVHPLVLKHPKSREKLIEMMDEILRDNPSAPGIEAQQRD